MRRLVASVLSILVAGGAPVAAGDAVRLYTNADLEKFGPPESERGEPVSAGADFRGWEFVEAFLDRERARIETERRLAVEREAARAAAEERVRRDVDRYHAAYAAWWTPWWRRHRGGAPREGPQEPGGRGVLAPRPIPIHARPTAFETGHSGGRPEGLVSPE